MYHVSACRKSFSEHKISCHRVASFSLQDRQVSTNRITAGASNVALSASSTADGRRTVRAGASDAGIVIIRATAAVVMGVRGEEDVRLLPH